MNSLSPAPSWHPSLLANRSSLRDSLSMPSPLNATPTLNTSWMNSTAPRRDSVEDQDELVSSCPGIMKLAFGWSGHGLLSAPRDSEPEPAGTRPYRVAVSEPLDPYPIGRGLAQASRAIGFAVVTATYVLAGLVAWVATRALSGHHPLVVTLWADVSA